MYLAKKKTISARILRIKTGFHDEAEAYGVPYQFHSFASKTRLGDFFILLFLAPHVFVYQ